MVVLLGYLLDEGRLGLVPVRMDELLEELYGVFADLPVGVDQRLGALGKIRDGGERGVARRAWARGPTRLGTRGRAETEQGVIPRHGHGYSTAGCAGEGGGPQRGPRGYKGEEGAYVIWRQTRG